MSDADKLEQEFYLEQEFGKAQQYLVDKFKERLKVAAADVLSDLYTDVANHAGTDAHINYHNYLRDNFRETLVKEISTEHSHYSWAHGIRMELLEKYPDILRNTIITDLQGEIKSLNEHIDQLRNRYR